MLDGKPHSLGIGVVDDYPWLESQTRLTFKNCGIIDPRSLEDYKAHGGYRGLAKALAVGPKATVEEVVTSGLRGRGGAGFPTGIKWRTVADTPPQQKYIVCNADEGDSGTFADRMIMEGDPFVLIEGMTIAGIAVGATYGYIYIRSEYPDAIEAMEIAVREARKGGMLGRRDRWLGLRFRHGSAGPAPAPMSAARRPRCSRAWKASAARSGRNLPSPPISACSASRPSSTTCCRLPPCRSS